ncbi:hypothetical protein [Flavobacterium sp.]|uniref:hypothetical protein n=1 Tax=Flavobacterium sp. TaxID=239 RepID=UPI003753CE5C
MKKLILLLIPIILIGCQKEINFKTIDEGIDDQIVKYDLINYSLIKTIKKDEFYKIMILDLEKGNPTKTQKKLAEVCKQLLNSKEFKKDEIISVVEFESSLCGFTHYEIGYFNSDIKLEYRSEIRPNKINM